MKLSSEVLTAVTGVLLAALVLSPDGAEAKFSKVTAKTDGFYHYIDKFGFDVYPGSQGNITVDLWSNDNMPNTRFVIFDDRSTAWFGLYDALKGCPKNFGTDSSSQQFLDCQELCEDAARAAGVVDSQQKSYSAAYTDTLFAIYTSSKQGDISYRHRFGEILPGARPYFWYLVLFNCDGTGIDVEVEVSFLNPGGEWREQFSVEVHMLTEVYIFFLVLFSVFTAAYIWGVHRNKHAHHVLQLTGLLAISLLGRVAGLVLFVMDMTVFKSDGEGLPSVRFLAEAVRALTTVFIIFLYLVIAKGWKLNREELKNTTVCLNLSVMMGLTVLYALVFVWEHALRDPAAHYFHLESTPGYMLIFARSLMWLYFVWAVHRTWSREVGKKRRRFWRRYFVTGTIWFLSFPVIILLSVVLSPWWRERIVFTVELCFDALGLGTFVYVTWPTRCRHFFNNVVVVQSKREEMGVESDEDLEGEHEGLKGQQQVPMPSPGAARAMMKAQTMESSVKMTPHGIVHLGSMSNIERGPDQDEEMFNMATVVVQDHSKESLASKRRLTFQSVGSTGSLGSNDPTRTETGGVRIGGRTPTTSGGGGGGQGGGGRANDSATITVGHNIGEQEGSKPSLVVADPADSRITPRTSPSALMNYGNSAPNVNSGNSGETGAASPRLGLPPLQQQRTTPSPPNPALSLPPLADLPHVSGFKEAGIDDSGK